MKIALKKLKKEAEKMKILNKNTEVCVGSRL